MNIDSYVNDRPCTGLFVLVHMGRDSPRDLSDIRYIPRKCNSVGRPGIM